MLVMDFIRMCSRRLSWLFLAIVIVFSLYYFTLSLSFPVTINNGTSNKISHRHKRDQTTTPLSTLTTTLSTPTSTPTTTTDAAKVQKCATYSVSDTRPFFEREPPQFNLPRRISNSSHQGIRRRLRSLRLAVVACAYNVEQNIDKFRKYIEPIVDLFHSSSRIIILESDSKDNTFAKFKQWSRAEVYTYGNLSTSIPYRTERIGYCRNELLKKARQIEPDYMLVADVDVFAVNVTSFLTNFDYDVNDWLVMTSNLANIYYDIWAVRTLSDSNLNYDIWHRIWALLINNYCWDSLRANIDYNQQKPYSVDRELFEVRSAFGGAAIYRMEATVDCEYSGHSSTCEHVPFSLCIREKHQARIFINAKFTNEDPYRVRPS